MKIIVIALITSCLHGCAAHFPLNTGLTTPLSVESKPYYLQQVGANNRSTELLVMLAFSGGGVRASALSYGVLKSLADTEIVINGKTTSLLAEVDLISSVSGGSFTAAYYGLYGDKLFTAFEDEFLNANIESGLVLQLLKPINWLKIWQPYFDRAEVASDYYDKVLFKGATYADLGRANGPAILINATDLTLGESFGFHQQQFDWICSNINDFSIARAVTASSAVPGLFSAVTLKNYAGDCEVDTPAWYDTAFWDLRPEIVEIGHKIRAYSDVKKRPYIHLVDGGLADNLGLRAISELVSLHGGAQQVLEEFNLTNTRKILIVTVNAAQQAALKINQSKNPPSLLLAIDTATTIQLNRFNRETVRLFKENVRSWQQEISHGRCGQSICDKSIEFYFVDVSLANIRDNALRQELQLLPTSFSLEKEAVDKLIQSADDLLQESRALKQFLGS